jgi:hypothetical protein
MTAVSQWEREAIGERTRDAIHHKRANGERVGTVPFGYGTATDALQLEADRAEQGILAAWELKATGRTTRQIAGRTEPGTESNEAGRNAWNVTCKRAAGIFGVAASQTSSAGHYFRFLIASRAATALRARSVRSVGVMDAAAFFPPALPPIFPPFAPCLRKNSSTSGGNFFDIDPS